jgi:CheY-like chemotaxis protein
LRALVVDDDPDTVDGMAILLRSQGAEVQTACSGVAAIQAAQATSPDLVLLDLGMPETDGYAVASALRAIPSANDSILVALTGYGDAPHKRRAAEVGFDLHLLKPVDWDVIQQLMASVSEARGLQQEWRHSKDRFHAPRLALARSQMDMVCTLLDVATTTARVDTRQRCIAKALNTCSAARHQFQRQGEAHLDDELAELEKRAYKLLDGFTA